MKERLTTPFVVVLISALFSAFTLFLIESWIKFILFGFELVAITFSYLLLQKDASISANKTFPTTCLRKLSFKFYSETFPSLVLIGMSISLLFLHFQDFDHGIFPLFLAIGSGGFLVGYTTLSIFRIGKYLTTIEFCVVSFLTSIAFTGILAIVFNPTGNSNLLMSISFLLIGIVSLFVTTLTNSKKDERQGVSLSRPIDLLALSLCLGFYLIFVIMAYPDAASIVGTDISRHFSYSAILSRTPDLYSAPHYLLFHSFQGAIFLLSGEDQSTILFLSSFAFLNIFLPLSVYAGSKRLLGSLDPRIPGLAVIFYTFMSNLSFLYFTTLGIVKPEQLGNEYFLVIREVAEKSYFSNINPLQPFNFVGPLTISIIIVPILFSIIGNRSIPRYRYIGLISFLIGTGGLIHAPEIALFVLLVSMSSIIRIKPFIRTKESLIAMSIGLIGSIVMFGIVEFSILAEDVIDFRSLIGALLLPVVVCVIALSLYNRRINLAFLRRYLELHTSGLIEGCVVVLVVIYLSGVAVWFFAEGFKTSALQGIGTVPTFLFPMMLGILGLLAIFSVRSLKDKACREPIMFLLFAIFLLLVIGKVLSFININFYDLPYWEKRIPGLVFVFVSMLAPIIVINLFDRGVLSKRRTVVISTVILASVLASIFLSGFSSLATQVEYWYIRAKGEGSLGIHETNAVDVLREIVEEQNSSATISPSSFSRHVVTFAAPTYQYPKPDVVFSSKSPSVPLLILGGLPHDRIYVYVHNRDLDILDRYPDSWFSKHLLPSLPVLYRNEEVRIYNATGLKSPQLSSDTAIVVPTDSISDDWSYVYNALSKSLTSYTETVSQDVTRMKNHNSIILTSDPVSLFNYSTNLAINNISGDFWRAKGKWEQSSEGLGGLGNYSDSSSNKNMLISKYMSNNNMTLSTLFKINNEGLNRRATTSVSFVLSWINQTNFDMGGAAFRDDNVYVYFANVSNSNLTFYPQFPYSAPLLTGLKWKTGSLFNMTVSIKEDIMDLYMNGTKYLSRPITDPLTGFTGLSTSGANDIIFTDLAVSTEDRTPRFYEDYYKYVSQGGNLIVFNTNGYGSIFDMLKETINSNDDMPLPQRSNTETYGSNLAITKAKLGNGNIEYMDVYRVLKNESLSAKEKNSLLEYSMNAILDKDLDVAHEDSREIPMIFQNIGATGDIEVNSSYLFFPNGINGKLVGIRTNDNPDLQSLDTNLSWLKPHGYNNTKLYLDNISFVRSGGLYSLATLGSQSMTLGFDPKTSIWLGFPNGSQSNFEDVTSITLETNRSLEAIMRTPTIKLDGRAHFINLHAAQLAGIDGENGIFSGRILFTVLSSDAYTLSDNVSFNGTFERSPTKYDEFSILRSSFFIFDIYFVPAVAAVLLAIPFILAAIFLFYKRIF